ncbi:Microtubule-nucleating Tub4p (gamma-tubulin) complex component [Coemansia sp. BCRC 34301]|nr:Microtubule-nucleating Tub4p (gamma-tubulin) complex component [Coemansia sp. BCRC 34301]
MASSELDYNLRAYINAFLGRPAAGDRGELERRDRLHRYFRTITDSNIAPAVSHDEASIVGEMQKRLVANGQDARSALQVSRLCTLLKQQDPKYDWWPILYLLSECSASGLPSSFSAATATSSYFAEPVGSVPSPSVGTSVRASQSFGPSNQNSQQLRYSPYGAVPRSATSYAVNGANGATAPVGLAYSNHAQATQPTLEQGALYLHRELPTYDDVAEADLLQDLIYVMQGIDGTYVHWNRLKSAYTIRPDTHLSRPTRSMVASLSELGGLTKDIQGYIGHVDDRGRLFEQSFCTELKAEMTDYYKLVADIESRLFKGPRTLRPGESPLGVTLRRMFNWTIEARQKLRLMAMAIAKVQEGKGGGDILSTISTLVDDGDPFIQSFAQRLLKTASAPFNNILVRWVTDGELVDPYREFFIREREGRRDMFWSEKYTVASDMIPVHINREMTRKIFQIGRSLNFLRVACDDAEWVATDGPRTQIVEGSDLSDPSHLESFVYRSSVMVNARLMSVLKEKFGLMGHIMAMRRYLLFEQGDFALALMEVLDNQIDRSGKNIMAHDLSAVLSSAVRSSNAQYENQDHLSAMLLTFSEEGAKHRGWDEVSLMYTLSAPLSYVVPKLALRQYVEVSQFMIRLKRVEHMLHSIWRQQMTEARSYLRSEELQRRKASAGDGGDLGARGSEDAMRQAMRQSAIACSEMVQFFHQVQRYISLNVIEGAWGEFLETTTSTADKAGDVCEIDIDKWNEAHSKYIGVVHDVVCGSGGGMGFQRNLAGIFDTAFQFIAVVREMYSERTLSSRRGTPSVTSPSLSDRLQQYRSSAAGASQQAGGASASASEHVSRVRTVVARFKEQVKTIMRVLSHNTASDLHFLVVTIDFNNTYAESA